ncbi:hypothetical protein [Streptomyces sp. uw30]|uniref:hypothetical protein n=1 Tax=Streptomyces sp. uw30 TaxID=1828179 RepID=UPI001650D88F|nr:hypothetical protein [Streptomyces sp. uw30]
MPSPASSSRKAGSAVTRTALPKAAAPKFLSASQLPPHPTSSWTAVRVTEEFPEALGLCVRTEGVLDYDYRHREFRTDLDASAVQLTVVTGTAAQAEALAKHYDDLIRTCADRIEESSPDVDAEGRDYGTLPVEEGAHVRGLNTETSGGATDIALLSVGRDDRTVTVVKWGEMCDFVNAPVTAFKKTTITAVNKLY